MALTDSQVIDKMRLRGVPQEISDAEITEAIAAWLEAVQEHLPVQALGQFPTVAGQQEYDLFGTGQPLEGGLDVLEIFTPQTCGGGDLDVFGVAPFLQDLGIGPPFDRDNYVFNIPGDFIIHDRVWDAFRGRFASLRFLRSTSAKGSPILLDPPPTSVETLVVRYTRPGTAAELRFDDATLLAGTEWRCLDLMARKYALSAGTRIGEHEDRGMTARLYREMADKMEQKAMRMLEEQTIPTVDPAWRS